jgi:uncharacterized protein (DUF58 family)
VTGTGTAGPRSASDPHRSRTATPSASTRGTASGTATRGTSSRGASTRGSAGRGATAGTASTAGLTNARTRIVGQRTGPAADALVAVVRIARAARRVGGAALGRASQIVTPLGWTMLAVVPVALAAGYALGWIELVVVGWAGVVLVAVAALHLVGAPALDATVSLAQERVVVGDRVEGALEVANRSRRRTLGSRVEVPVGAALTELDVPGIAAGGSRRVAFEVATSRRGRLAVGPARTVRADPVGLVRRELRVGDPVTLHVHPRTIAVTSTSTGLVRDLEGGATRDVSTDDVSFHTLREYVPGDERRYIHWRSTARTGTYMVRQFEQTRRSRLVVALSTATGDYAGEEEFELAVSCAGSLGARAIRDARDVSVVVGASTPAFAKRRVYDVRPLSTLTRNRLLDDLAGVSDDEAALGVGDLARVTASRVDGISVAFLVCGSGVPTARLRAASVAFPAGVEVVAIVCDPVTVPGLRRVPGLSVVTVGSLDDLRTALARSRAA